MPKKFPPEFKRDTDRLCRGAQVPAPHRTSARSWPVGKETPTRRLLLRRIAVRGFRASAVSGVLCEFPGRFSLLVGANNAGKSTVADASHRSTPGLPADPEADRRGARHLDPTRSR